jgi:hypothetical protein
MKFSTEPWWGSLRLASTVYDVFGLWFGGSVAVLCICHLERFVCWGFLGSVVMRSTGSLWYRLGWRRFLWWGQKGDSSYMEWRGQLAASLGHRFSLNSTSSTFFSTGDEKFWLQINGNFVAQINYLCLFILIYGHLGKRVGSRTCLSLKPIMRRHENHCHLLSR